MQASVRVCACVRVRVCVYLELIFNLAGVCLRVQSADVIVNGSELTHWNGCISTQTCLQDSIMNKHILFLEQQHKLLVSIVDRRATIRFFVLSAFTLAFLLAYIADRAEWRHSLTN